MFPALAMSYVAERLRDEGWFDNKGWLIDEPDAARPQKWFPERDAVVVGERYNWGVEFWRKAHHRWKEHGERNHLILSPTREADLRNQGRKVREALGLKPEERVMRFRPEDVPESLRPALQAARWLDEYEYYRGLTNFAHFYNTSMVELNERTVQARKRFFEAERLRLQARRGEALARYEEALPIWKQLLEEHADFQRDDHIQEETYEVQAKYLDLLRAVHGPEIKQRLALQTLLGQAAAGTSSLSLVVSARLAVQPRLLPDLELMGPFDGNTQRGEPFIKETVVNLVRHRNPNLRPGPR
jgi:hypothetical protein